MSTSKVRTYGSAAGLVAAGLVAGGVLAASLSANAAEGGTATPTPGATIKPTNPNPGRPKQAAALGRDATDRRHRRQGEGRCPREVPRRDLRPRRDRQRRRLRGPHHEEGRHPGDDRGQ